MFGVKILLNQIRVPLPELLFGISLGIQLSLSYNFITTLKLGEIELELVHKNLYSLRSEQKIYNFFVIGSIKCKLLKSG